jgi:hypothetical protein
MLLGKLKMAFLGNFKLMKEEKKILNIFLKNLLGTCWSVALAPHALLTGKVYVKLVWGVMEK